MDITHRKIHRRIKHSILFISLCISLTVFAQHDTIAKVPEFGSNPGNLKMFIYNPFTNSDTIPRPLVVVLHGCNQSAQAAAELTGWNKIAYNEKFYVVYPEQKIVNNPSRCFNWFLSEDIEKNSGENASIYSMIQRMKTNFKIDTARIFVTGLSAGGAMTVVMLADYPQVFKAGSAFAGGPYKAAVNVSSSLKVFAGKLTRTPHEWSQYVFAQNKDYKGNYPSLSIWHGENDLVVNKRTADELVKQWRGVTGCDSIAAAVEKNFGGNTDFTRATYQNKIGEDKVIHYQVNNLGHEYPIYPGEEKNRGGKKRMFAALKKFHATWQTAKDFGLVTGE